MFGDMLGVNNIIHSTCGKEKYDYLLGQTFPYHEAKESFYPVTDLAFIQTKDGKRQPLVHNNSNIASFITLGRS